MFHDDVIAILLDNLTLTILKTLLTQKIRIVLHSALYLLLAWFDMFTYLAIRTKISSVVDQCPLHSRNGHCSPSIGGHEFTQQ